MRFQYVPNALSLLNILNIAEDNDDNNELPTFSTCHRWAQVNVVFQRQAREEKEKPSADVEEDVSCLVRGSEEKLDRVTPLDELHWFRRWKKWA